MMFRTMFNDKLLDYRENGDLERLGRFWLHGTCKPNEQEKRASEPLSEAQVKQQIRIYVEIIRKSFIYLGFFPSTLNPINKQYTNILLI